jgi:hypothetical protein
MKKLISAGFAAITLTTMTLAAPLAAGAQSAPSYAYASEVQIRGRVAGFDGGYDLTVRDERGFLDNVQLHQGTIINPAGLTLRPGMIVSILGYDAGSFFGANEIDTPYTFYAGVPYCYGHPWNYYGPAFELGFFFGNPAWWHGGYFHDGYRWNAGVRVYDHVRVGYWNHGWHDRGWGGHIRNWDHPDWAGHGPAYGNRGPHEPNRGFAGHGGGYAGRPGHGEGRYARGFPAGHFHGPAGHVAWHGASRGVRYAAAARGGWHAAHGGGYAPARGGGRPAAHGGGHGRR